MMFNKLKIKNIGKLTNTDIEIGQFTVFAGTNNTGKSFVSKTVYSIFNALNANHANVYIENSIYPILDSIDLLIKINKSMDKDILYPLSEEIENIKDILENFTIKDINELDKFMHELTNNIENINQRLFNTFTQIKSAYKQQDLPNTVKNDLNDIEKVLIKLHKSLDKINTNEYIFEGIKYKIIENLTQNFQIPNLNRLKGKENVPSEVNMGDLGKFEFSKEKIEFNIDFNKFQQLQEYSRVIYLGSPSYWELKPALESIKLSPRFQFSKRTRLSGIPEYFYDLAMALKEEYTGDMDFPNLYERLTSKEGINGKITISENGDLSFQENGHNFSLPMTSMGVINLGILALLIERKVLEEGTFLFIDEPEAHLHPTWQITMAETLLELAKGGVNVVIATHSPDILEWLEIHTKKNPKDKEIIALNHFKTNKDKETKLTFNNKLAKIKEELRKPFRNPYTVEF